jgi:phosphatidate cytidylyltransferase
MTSTQASASKHADLKQRLITALLLAALVLGILLWGSAGLWALLITVFCMAAAWEAGRLSKLSAMMQVLQFAVIGATILVLWVLFLRPHVASDAVTPIPVFLLVVCAFWIVVVPMQLSSRRIDVALPWGLLIWPLVIGGAWISAVMLRQAGISFLVAVVVITVVADVAAYFVGRKFGRVKLAPSISPGKTREGAIGGIVAAGLWTACCCVYLNVTSGSFELLIAAMIGALLGAFAVAGDLWESQLKRQASVKDSSNLLPGHGGVLDRIDAQLAVLPLATLALSTAKALW